MSKGTAEHLKSVTSEGFKEWIESKSFMAFASSAGSYGHIQLGVNGKGEYIVRNDGQAAYCSTPEAAIKLYTELLTT